jgi:hypothetical protein
MGSERWCKGGVSRGGRREEEREAAGASRGRGY